MASKVNCMYVGNNNIISASKKVNFMYVGNNNIIGASKKRDAGHPRLSKLQYHLLFALPADPNIQHQRTPLNSNYIPSLADTIDFGLGIAR